MKVYYTSLFIILTLLCSTITIAQTVFRGTVIDSETKQPISQARVGINNQGIGEITDAKGFFNYRKYHEILSSDSKLVVGASGYESLELDAEKVRTLFNRSSKIELEPSSKKQRVTKVSDLTVFWDVSEDMKGRDVAAEISYVQQYVSAYKELQLRLVVFDYKVRSEELMTIRDGDISRFRESVNALIYNGPSNYDILDIAGADAVILSSNGTPNYGTFQVSQEVPVYVISSQSVAVELDYVRSLATYTQGDYSLLQVSGSTVSDNKVVTPKVTGPTIKGKVTSLGKPLQEVSVVKKGDFTEYLTKADGSFEIPASDGDVLQFRYLGMFPKDVLVSDQKAINVELLPENNVLDEVVITKKIEKIIVGDKEIRGRRISDIPGGVTGALDRYITADDITPNAKTLEYVLRDNFKRVRIVYTPAGVRLLIKNQYPKFYINGGLIRNIDEALAIVDKDIESVIIKDTPNMTSRYGPIIEGFAVIITTKTADLSKKKRANAGLVNGNNYTEEVQGISGGVITGKAQIIGKVTSLGKPIQGATITKIGTFEEYTSTANGSFNAYANDGDQFIVSYLGMYPKSFEVETISSYTIDLVPKNDVLDEVVLEGKGEEKNEVQTAWGKENRDKLGYDVKEIKKEDISLGAPDLVAVLNQKFAGIRANDESTLTVFNSRGESQPDKGRMLIVIDGAMYPPNVERPFISPDRVESISIIKSLAGANRYGLFGRNGVVEITTNISSANATVAETPSALVEGNDYEEEVQSLSDPLLGSSSKVLVRGVVRSPKGFLEDVTITRKGSFDEVYTDSKGTFTIKASIDDVLVISKVGMFTKEVLIESQNIGIIELTPKNDELDEIVVSGGKRVDNTIESNDGRRINKDKLGYAASEIDENDFSAGATTLQQLITGKVSGVSVEGGHFSGSEVVYKIRGGTQSISTEIPPIWIVNGTPYQDPPNFLDVQQIKSITVLKSVSATSRYGTLAAGGAFLIKTKEVSFENKAKEAAQSALVSGNEYTESSTRTLDTSTLPEYIVRLREIPNIEEQFETYQRISRTQESPLEFYVDVAQYFDGINSNMADQVRADLAYISRNNTKALRTLCYIYEAAGDYKKAALIYERILKIVPSEAQSYRDLALAYQEIGRYNEALELYYNMLGEQIKGVDFRGLEKTLRNELSHLLALHKDQVDYDRFPNEWLRTDFDIDIRMVIDWSDRSVPFEFQFVNPEKKFFKWTHALEENRERLEAEQAQGYQTEEFIIDDAPSGEWLINIQYLGDEGDYVLPPFLKYTVYRNYGTPQETKEIKVVKLFKQSDKVTLGKVML
ncbi:carboxypeptidase-like regulatory domain-containing protein [uncultured Dokdonia sp.]|uniref:carboxypeptidase-like regulatory domain-containing protein n=1 Tax=uncultured Dokdonia sp. TaxID=575653 RepID=UPI002635BAAC|nr:carboxypeptidase-like regulatory domain-containing protein [uncultured Dokdonia sp.]